MAIIRAIFCSVDNSEWFLVGPEDAYDQESVEAMKDRLEAISAPLGNYKYIVVPYYYDTWDDPIALDDGPIKLEYAVVCRLPGSNKIEVAHMSDETFDNMLFANSVKLQLEKETDVLRYYIIPMVI